jgi:pimeloyl-ACP methyl ester carboxylesterase
MKKVMSKDGTVIAFDRLGKGCPIILIDGALCTRSFGTMPKLVPFLARSFSVITYDRRGRGESGDTAPYAVEREIEDIEALVEEAGEPVFVFGVSSGAALALRAATGGLDIRKMALYEPPFVSGGPDHQPPTDCEVQLTRLIEAGRRGAAVKFFMTKMVGMPAVISNVMRLLPIWSKLKTVAHTLPYDAAIMGDFSLPSRSAASVGIPTIVIGGENSPEGLRKAVNATAMALPHGTRVVLKGQRYNVSAPIIAPVLVDFFGQEG